MTRIIHIDCERTDGLIRLRNDYVALQERDPNNRELSLATLDEDGWGMRLSDEFFKRFLPEENPDYNAREIGYLKYDLVLRSNLEI